MDPKLQKVLSSNNLNIRDIVRIREIPLKELSELTPENRLIAQENYVEVVGKFQTQLKKDVRKTLKMAKKLSKNKEHLFNNGHTTASTTTTNYRSSRRTDPTASSTSANTLNQAIQQPTLPSEILEIENADQARHLATLLENIPGPSSRDAISTMNLLMEEMPTLGEAFNTGGHKSKASILNPTLPFPPMEEPNLFITLPGEPEPEPIPIDFIPEAAVPPLEPPAPPPPDRTPEEDLQAELSLFGLLPLRRSSNVPATTAARGRKRKARSRPLKLISYANYYPRPARPGQLEESCEEYPEEMGIYPFLRNRLMAMTIADLTRSEDHPGMDVEQEKEPTPTAEVVEIVLPPIELEMETRATEQGVAKEVLNNDDQIIFNPFEDEEQPQIPNVTVETSSIVPQNFTDITPEPSNLPIIPMEIEQQIEKIALKSQSPAKQKDQEVINQVSELLEVTEVPLTSKKIAPPVDFSTPSAYVPSLADKSGMSQISLPLARAEQSIDSIPSLRCPNNSTLQANSMHVSNLLFSQQFLSPEKMNFLRETHNKLMEHHSILISELLTDGESRINMAWKLRLLTEFDSQLWRLEINSEHNLIGISKLNLD